MSASGSTALELLLCDADERTPVLPGGLPDAALTAAPAPDRGPRGKDSMHLEALDRDPNDLAAQQWAVIAPEGAAGDEALAAIRVLVEHRRDQQGADPIVFRVPDRMDAAAAMRWKNDVLRSEDLPADQRPRYLLILGDLDRVSLELQHVLANGSFVGRLHCPSARGYRAYAEKVVARERGPRTKRPRALYYTVQDGTSAIATGHRHLVAPSMRMTADLAARGKLAVDGPTEVPHSEWGPDELFALAGVDAPSLLVSLSHGLGAPRRGWRSLDQQRALQGALSLGGEDPLTADMVRESPFLPGGVWLCVACYGAGTPASSAFHPWLSLLAERGGAGDPAAVLRALPKDGERPFVAALPQALLANPAGPVAVIGHMDLAWTFGFTDPDGRQSRASRMHAAQRALFGGSRAGVGLDAIMHAYREVNDDLMARYQLQRDALARNQADPVDPRQLGDGWMQRNDLRGYVLLGDPAARLAVVGEARVALAEASELRDRPSRPVEVGAGVGPPAPAPVAPTPAPAVDPELLAPAQTAAVAPTPAQPPPPQQATATAPRPPDAALAATTAAPTQPTAAVAHAVQPAAASVAPRAVPQPVAAVVAPTPSPLAQPWPASPAEPAPPAPAPPWPPAAVTHVLEVPMSTPTQPPPPASYETPPHASVHAPAPPPAYGAAPPGATTRPRTLENPEIGLRERAVLAMLRGDEAPRGIAVRFGLPLEEIFYWLDVYREAGRRALGG